MFEHEKLDSQFKTILGNFDDDPVDAILLWMQQDPEAIKEFVDLYHQAINSVGALEDFLDKGWKSENSAEIIDNNVDKIRGSY